ncbi:MAG: hypothetical protein ABI614_14520, partial [Planctomycetota bacterium]
MFSESAVCKGPFIADQALQWLDAPVERRFECLELGRFRAARQAKQEGAELGPEQQLPPGCQWIEVSGRAEREEFLMDTSRQRVCLLIEAGIGKTTAMQQIAYLRSCAAAGHVALAFPFAMLPDPT